MACQIIDMFSSDSSIKMYYCSPEGSVRQTVEEKGISYIGMPELSVPALKKAIFDIRPDIIHAHDMRAGVMASLCCGKIPLISHIHNNAFDSRGISLKSISYYLAARKAKHIFWVSRSAFEGYAFHKQLDKKSSILFNVININALQKRMNADEYDYTYDIVFLGRLTVPKNPERLIEVLERVIRKRPNTSIAIVGTGELDDVIKALVKEKGLLSNIQFLGFQSNPYKILHDAKLMIMTSRWEGTPMCALEAMALGVPIVSTPTDGLKDVVKNE